MQGQLSKHRAAPSIPSVIAQLFALEDEGRQDWVTKQPGPGTCWQELVWSFLQGGLAAEGERRFIPRGPCEEAGEPPGTGFFWLPFHHREGRVEGEEPTHFLFVFISQFNSEQVKTRFGGPSSLSIFCWPRWCGKEACFSGDPGP